MFDDVNDIEINSILTKYGIDDVDEYLRGNTVEPTTNYDNIDEWCEVLHKYIESNRTIYVLVDSDMDGSLSSSLFHVYVKTIPQKAKIIPLFHHKNPKAHGLGDKEIMKQLKLSEPSLLVLLDAGSQDKRECAQLKKLGYEIICSDHHFFKEWNDECVLVNNHASHRVTNKGLCGTGVTWKCLKRHDELYGYNIANKLISYVAFANVSDSMSLVYQENRSFAKWGFKRIHKNLQPFFDEFIKDGVIVNDSVAWNTTPKGNALIRLGELQDKIDFFYALCGEYEVNDIIDRMKKYHAKQGIDKKKLLEDIDIVYNGTCVLAKVKTKTALTGLVANMMSSTYMKPILLVHDSEGGQSAGSVRSSVPIKKALVDSGLFDYNDGHEDFAFGTAYQTNKEQEIIDYLDSLTDVSEPCREVLVSSMITNIPTSLYSLKMDYNELWSNGVNKPILHIKPFTIYNTDIQTLGKGGTIKFTKDGVDFISFFTSNDMKERLYMNVDEKVKMEMECIVELGINRYTSPKNGKTYVNKQAIIQDFECRKVDEKILMFEDIWGLTD